MFKNKYRLRNPQDITQIFETGKYFHGKYVLIKYLPNTKNHPRLAIGISTKLFKKATQRNKIKRLIREASKPILGVMLDFDYLIIVKNNIINCNGLLKLQQDITQIINKIKHYYDNH